MAANDSNTGAASRPERIVVHWWSSLKTHRGARAELRRAKTLEEVFLAPAFHELRLELLATRWRDPTRVALIAAVLARVEENVEASTEGRRLGAASQMAQHRQGSEAARVSDLRFRRLLATRGPEDLFQQMPRIVGLLSGKVDVADLAGQLYNWERPSTRRRWALEYYEHAPRTRREE